ncbi:MAG: serine hydrolase [Kiritimatiellaeota bacterium]|nr:serine hydrolase [Kiritimatiellota bacterium]
MKIFLAAGWCVCAVAAAAPGVCPASGDAAITEALQIIRKKFDVPAIAGAIVTSKGLERYGVVGVRKRGAEVAVTTNDLWHLGSDTKAMTATLAGVLVEAGKLKWDTTVAEVFPELAAALHPATTNLTLKQLLSHRAGLPGNLNWGKFNQGDIRELRVQALREALAKKPEYAPGEHFQYSNLGYVIAGAMIEKVTQQPWADAIRDRVFKPLGMTSVGVGGFGTPGQLDQPWGHVRGGQPVSRNGPAMDNLAVIGPAGRVHCTMQDWARFIADQLRGVRGERALLKTATYQFMQTPPFGGDYALGWGLAKRDWGGGPVLNHCGCNTMFYANVWVAPLKDFAVLVCINQGDDVAFKASDAAAAALIRLRR